MSEQEVFKRRRLLLKFDKEFNMLNRTLRFIFLSAVLFSSPLLAYLKTTHMVAMRDGLKLATDVYLADVSAQKWPAILIRTPYGKTGFLTPTNTFDDWVKAGYALVVQDTRGRGDSQGVDSLFLDDGWGGRQDGYDTVEWIAAQSWCNGKVGTLGESAFGITQYMLAGSAPPHLVCQFVKIAATNLYTQAVYPGGVFLKNLAESWLTIQGARNLLPYIESRASYDATWERLNLESRFSAVNVPVYHWGGWYDVFSEGTISGFVGLQHNGTTGAAGKQKLLVGPWTHGNWKQTRQGDLNFPNSTHDDMIEARRWFEYWLLGRDNGIMSEPAVKYYMMGAPQGGESGAPGNVWRTERDWPPRATVTPFYFHDNGELSTEKSAMAQASRSYQYDPRNPVQTQGGRNLLMAAGPHDQRSVENRTDVLIFTTPVLAQPLEIAGKVTAKLWVSSSAKDTDFMVKLTDVYPDGRSMLVSDGAIRARHRYSLWRENFMTPDSIYLCEVDLWSTAIIFNKSHRLRVAISSSNSPRFDPNPNTGRPFRADNAMVVATNTLHLDAARPSHLSLPITIPGGGLAVAGPGASAPRDFILEQNYPNPVLDETQIAYAINRTSTIRLSIFNMLGQELRTLVEGLAPVGKYAIKWDGRDHDGRRAARGIYFYRFTAGNFVATRKLVVVQ
jgi:hypothetical protein